MLLFALYCVLESMEPLYFDSPKENDVDRRFSTSANVFVSARYIYIYIYIYIIYIYIYYIGLNPLQLGLKVRPNFGYSFFSDLDDNTSETSEG